MGYGYKRKRRYTRRPYRRRFTRRGGRGFARSGRGRSIFAPRTPGSQSGIPRSVVRALKRAAADPGSSLSEYMKPDKIAKLVGDLKDHASRFVKYNTFGGLSAREVQQIIQHPSFGHVGNAAGDIRRGDYWGAARNMWRFWANHPYERSDTDDGFALEL